MRTPATSNHFCIHAKLMIFSIIILNYIIIIILKPHSMCTIFVAVVVIGDISTEKVGDGNYYKLGFNEFLLYH